MKEEYKIVCSNANCSSVNTDKPIDIEDKLLLIGGSYKCPYCREYEFHIVKKVLGSKKGKYEIGGD